MLRFRDYTTLLEGKADDLRQEFQAMPSHSHLVDLDNPTLVKFGQGLKKMSDVPQNIGDVRQTLDAFNKHGPKLAGNLKDFSQHPSFTHVQQALQPHVEKAALKAQKKQTGVAGEETIHDDGQGTVVKEIHTPEAASQPKYCDTTGWCVSRQGETGKKFFKGYQNRGGTGRKGEARMFVIHTPDNELHAYHEGEMDGQQNGIIRDKQDYSGSISDFTKKYPQISQVTELHKTKHGNEFKPAKEVNSPEDLSEVLNDQKSSLASVRNAFESKYFGPEHMDKLLNHKMLNVINSRNNENYKLADDAINSEHFKPEHVDNIINNENNHLLQHVPLNKFTPAHVDKLIDSMRNNGYWSEKHTAVLASLIGQKAPAIQPHHIERVLNLKHTSTNYVNYESGHAPTNYVDYESNRLYRNTINHPYFSQEHFNSIVNDPNNHHLLKHVSDKLTAKHVDKFLESPNAYNMGVLSHIPNLIQPHHIDKILDMQGGSILDEDRLKNTVGYLHHEILNHPNFSDEHLDKVLNKHMETNGTQYNNHFIKKVIEKKSKMDNNFFGDLVSNPNLTFDKKIHIIINYPEGELQSHHIDSILNNPNSEKQAKHMAINSRNIKQHHLDNIINNPEKHDESTVNFAKNRRFDLNQPIPSHIIDYFKKNG